MKVRLTNPELIRNFGKEILIIEDDGHGNAKEEYWRRRVHEGSVEVVPEASPSKASPSKASPPKPPPPVEKEESSFEEQVTQVKRKQRS